MKKFMAVYTGTASPEAPLPVTMVRVRPSAVCHTGKALCASVPGNIRGAGATEAAPLA